MENIGLKRGYLELHDYREDYPSIYEKAKEELLDIYKDRIKYIDHVGSTSIKGIKSKPIIDINIQTDDLDEFKKYTESNVEGDVYTVKKEPTLGGDYLIRKEEDGKVKAFIHVFKIGDINGITSMLFRDYLNSHEDERKHYQELKMELYDKYRDNRKEYTHGKDEYIKKIISLAMEEKYICKVANRDELLKRWDYLIEIHPGNSKWVEFKENALKHYDEKSTISYFGFLNDEIICEITAYVKESAFIGDISELSGLLSDSMAYLSAFRTNKEFEGKGYFSKLYNFVENDLKEKGYTELSLGVGPEAVRNIEIYFHLGYRNYIKTLIEYEQSKENPLKKEEDVILFYKKKINHKM